MSYYLKLNFIEAVETGEVLPTIAKLKRQLYDNAEEIVAKHFDERPSACDEVEYTSFDEYAKDEKLRNHNACWLSQLFSIVFIYYPRLKVLAFVTNGINEFDYPYIEFQNGCDQDYSAKYYSGIAFAERLYKEVFDEDGYQTKDWYDFLCDNSFNEDDDNDYIKRTFVYEKIEKMLDIKMLMRYWDGNFDNEEHYLIDLRMVSLIKLHELSKLLNRKIKNEYDKLNSESELLGNSE